MGPYPRTPARKSRPVLNGRLCRPLLQCREVGRRDHDALELRRQANQAGQTFQPQSRWPEGEGRFRPDFRDAEVCLDQRAHGVGGLEVSGMRLIDRVTEGADSACQRSGARRVEGHDLTVSEIHARLHDDCHHPIHRPGQAHASKGRAVQLKRRSRGGGRGDGQMVDRGKPRAGDWKLCPDDIGLRPPTAVCSATRARSAARAAMVGSSSP